MIMSKAANRKIAYNFIIKSLPVVILLFIAICVIIYKIESSTQEEVAKMHGSEAVKQTESALKDWIDNQVHIAKMVADTDIIFRALKYQDDSLSVARAKDFLETIHRHFPYLENLPVSINLPAGTSLNVQVGNEMKTVKDGVFFIDTVGGKTIGKCNAELAM